ncbi:HD-GYP domain-containing protein [Patescibacteria group bacterium]
MDETDKHNLDSQEEDAIDNAPCILSPKLIVDRIVAKTRLDLNTAHRLLSTSLTEMNLPVSLNNDWEIAISEENLRNIHLIHFAVASGVNEVLRVTHPDVSSHSDYVAYIATHLATILGLDQKQAMQIAATALTHDVGKITFPKQFLDPSRQFTRVDSQVIRAHTVLGGKILRNGFFPEKFPQVAEEHHENVDGSGYTKQLRGEEISIAGRILRVADSFAAATDKDRTYKIPLTPEQALEDIKKKVGTEYDAKVVQGLERVFELIKQAPN